MFIKASALMRAAFVSAALAGCEPDIEIPPAQVDAAMVERQRQAFIEALKPRRPTGP